jgi:glycosyltransferase involved in cell wall biosynthesis
VPPADPEALAAGIIELLTETDKAKHFGRAGRDRVLQEFSVSTMVDRTVAIYAKLMGEGARDGS